MRIINEHSQPRDKYIYPQPGDILRLDNDDECLYLYLGPQSEDLSMNMFDIVSNQLTFQEVFESNAWEILRADVVVHGVRK